jgi:hypothetical protein
MGNTSLAGGKGGLGNPPSDVQVTVLRLPYDRGGVPKSYRWVVVAAVLVLGVFVALLLGGAGPSRGVDAGVSDPGAPGVAAAYGYPTTCLKVAISALDRAFARADFEPATRCGLPGTYPTAMFHRFAGEWHPVLFTVSYPCPMPSIPASVQVELSLCPRSASAARAGDR